MGFNWAMDLRHSNVILSQMRVTGTASSCNSDLVSLNVNFFHPTLLNVT